MHDRGSPHEGSDAPRDPGKAAGRRPDPAVARLVSDQGLDGADIDWEYPEPHEAGGYAALVNELSIVLRPAGKLLTAAVSASSWGSGGIAAETFANLDTSRQQREWGTFRGSPPAARCRATWP